MKITLHQYDVATATTLAATWEYPCEIRLMEHTRHVRFVNRHTRMESTTDRGTFGILLATVEPTGELIEENNVAVEPKGGAT